MSGLRIKHVRRTGAATERTTVSDFIDCSKPGMVGWLDWQIRVSPDAETDGRKPLPEVTEGGSCFWIHLADEDGTILTVHGDCSVTWDGDRERLLRFLERANAQPFPGEENRLALLADLEAAYEKIARLEAKRDA